MYHFRPSAAHAIRHFTGPFTVRRLFHIHDPYRGWMESVGRGESGILLDLREPFATPFIFKSELKPGFYFKEYVF